jgi:carboxypeptidase PM20D1
VAPLMIIGVTDSRHMSVLTDDIYRFSPMSLELKEGAMAHGFDERISIENFSRMISFYSQVLAGGTTATLP